MRTNLVEKQYGELATGDVFVLGESDFVKLADGKALNLKTYMLWDFANDRTVIKITNAVVKAVRNN